MLFVVCDQKGIDVKPILSQIPYTKEHIQTSSNFIEWDSMVTLFDAIAAQLTEKEIFQIAEATYKHPLFRVYALIGKLRFDLIQFYIYIYGPDGVVPSFYPMTSELLDYDKHKRQVSFRFSVSEDIRPCENLYKVFVGQAIGMSAVMGYDKAEVTASYSERSLTMAVILPKEDGFISMLRKILFFPLGMFRSARALQQTHDTLVRRNRELEIETSNLRQAQESLHLHQEQLSLIAKNTSLLFWTLDLNLKPQYFSESVNDLMGFTTEEALAMPALGMVHEQSKQDALDSLARHLELELQDQFPGSTILRLKQVRKDGSTFWSETHASFLRNLEGEAIGVVGVTIDIDNQIRQEQRQQELEEKLIESRHSELVGKVAGGIAHDFNNSLQAIIGFTEMTLSSLQEEASDRSLMAEYQNNVLYSAKSASELVRQLLALGRRQTLTLEVIELSDWLQTLLPMVETILAGNVNLSVDIADGLTFQADSVQLERVLANLVLNARDAMPTGGQMTITGNFVPDSVHTTAMVKLTLKDSGIGIKEENLLQIFEPFFTSKTNDEGRGLGLAVSAGIIEQHNGTIIARSTEGTGTSFEVSLPFVEAESTKQEQTASELPHLTSGFTLLVVDDRDMIRELIRSILRSHAVSILEAKNGEEAVQAFEKHRQKIDIVLMDLVMPVMNGDAAAAKIREIKHDIPIIFMTGYAGDQTNLESLQNEIVMTKPFDQRILLNLLQEQLTR